MSEKLDDVKSTWWFGQPVDRVMVPAVLTLLLDSCWYVFRRPFLTIRKWYGAKLMSKFSHKYSSRMCHRTRRLFAELQNLADVRGSLKIVEIEAGTGANFEFFPKGSRVTCIDPNDKNEPYLLKSVELLSGNARFVRSSPSFQRLCLVIKYSLILALVILQHFYQSPSSRSFDFCSSPHL